MGLPRGVPVFWSTLLLLVASLVVAQAVGFALLFIAPPPRPDFNRMSDIVAALSGTPVAHVRAGAGDDRERELTVRRSAMEPAGYPAMTSDPAFTAALAERLSVPVDRVRLLFEPDRRGGPFGRRGGRRPVGMHDGEPLFFTPLVAGVHDARGWRIAETGAPPLIAPWQRRMMLWFAASLLLLLPLAWGFARAITRPISRFADAADRLGADPQAPALPDDGPAELRVTAHALNRMHARLAEYIGERTSMIGAIAHDLRTPLARIAFRIETAPEPMREKVLADVEQMRAMLSATIGFVRSTEASGERVTVDLADVLAGIVAEECDTGRPVALGRLAPAQVTGDPLALHRLFQNLVDNGVVYGNQVEVSLREEAGHAAVIVADRGPGMTRDLLGRAFQPFVRGDPSRNRATGGIGLGLTIARAITEDHGGTLVLANRDGGGLEARCTLPLAG